jgi:hypothetical protein
MPSAMFPMKKNVFSRWRVWAGTLGLGVELGLSQNWSVKFEYLYADFGSHDVLFPLAAQKHDSNLTPQTIQAGLNYHFGDLAVHRSSVSAASRSQSTRSVPIRREGGHFADRSHHGDAKVPFSTMRS